MLNNQGLKKNEYVVPATALDQTHIGLAFSATAADGAIISGRIAGIRRQITFTNIYLEGVDGTGSTAGFLNDANFHFRESFNVSGAINQINAVPVQVR